MHGAPQVEIQIGASNLDPAKGTPSWDRNGNFALGPPSDLGSGALPVSETQENNKGGTTQPNSTQRIPALRPVQISTTKLCANTLAA